MTRGLDRKSNQATDSRFSKVVLFAPPKQAHSLLESLKRNKDRMKSLDSTYDFDFLLRGTQIADMLKRNHPRAE